MNDKEKAERLAELRAQRVAARARVQEAREQMLVAERRLLRLVRELGR